MTAKASAGVRSGVWALPMALIRLVSLLLLSLLVCAPVGASSGAVTLVPESTDVLEVLRLRVPSEGRSCWREAEAEAWEPWLGQQRGYRGRELFWDPQRQEALLIIGWAHREDWKRIPEATLDGVQGQFERAAHRCLAERGPSANDRLPLANPFPIVSSGELLHERLGGGGGPQP